MRVLVADDDEAVRGLLRRWFERLGWSVEVFDNGAALVRASRRLAPDLVVSDVGMPGRFDGLRACRAIRRKQPQARVILITGDSSKIPGLRRAGFSRILAKPFLLGELAALVAESL